MFRTETLLIIVPAMPLLAALVTAATGAKVLRRRSHLPTVVAIGVSCVAAVLLVFGVQDQCRQATEQEEAKEEVVCEQLESPWWSVTTSRSVNAAGKVAFEQTVTLWKWAAVEGAYNQAGKAGKGVRNLLCEAPEGPFRQKVPDTFSVGGGAR